MPMHKPREKQVMGREGLDDLIHFSHIGLPVLFF
jgi:hypothetical protein